MSRGFKLNPHVEGDWPGAPYVGDVHNVREFVNPDPDGDGLASNGKPVLTADEAADVLNRGGARWPITGNGVITYTFLEKAPGGQYNSPKNFEFLGSYVEGFSPFTAEQRDTAREAIGLWDDLIAPSFVERNGRGADITFMNTSTGPAQASAYTPFYGGGHGKFHKLQGDTFFNQDQEDNFDLFYGGYGQTTLVHEIGHAVGLEHPGDYNFSDDEDGDGKPDPITYDADAFYFQDSLQYTIMSYFHAGETGARGFVNWYTLFAQTPQTPMLHDIAAVQKIYGADPTTRTGDTTYGFNSTADRDVFDFTVNKDPFLTIYDAGGYDTLDFSGWTVNTVLDLNQGGFSTGYSRADAARLNELFGFVAPQAFWDALFAGNLGTNPGYLSDNISIAFGTVIEDGVTGSGNDVLLGNEVGNRLNGGAGADRYTGGGGADIFEFSHLGSTDRILDFDSAVDKIDVSDLISESNFSFIGANAFTGKAGEVRFAGGTLLGDANGDGAADFAIIVTGEPVVATDFVFP